MTERKTTVSPLLGMPYGTVTGRLSRSMPEMQDLPGAKAKRSEAMIRAFAAFYGAKDE